MAEPDEKGYLDRRNMIKGILGASLLGLTMVSLVPQAYSAGQKTRQTYGCSIEPKVIDKGGYYTATIDLRFRQHKTGIKVGPNERAVITALGEGCLSKNVCGGPEGIENVMWPLYACLNEPQIIGPRGRSISETAKGGLDMVLINDSEAEAELYFVVIDGPIEKRGSCVRDYYRDNNGEFKVRIRVRPNTYLNSR